MSLILNVPALKEKPALLAETRPKFIQEKIAALPQGNPRAAARLLLDELEHLNRQQASIEQRLTALELYRPAVLNVALGLSRQYGNQPLPLQQTARSQAELAQHLFTELAYGYKHAILAEDDKLFTLGSNSQFALLIQRTIDALGRLLQVHYFTYTPAAAGIWQELHALYLRAARHALQNLEVPDTDTNSSINTAYKHILLLSLTNPAHLNATDLARVISYLDQHAHLGQLHPLGGLESKAGIFLINLKSDTPPQPLTKSSGQVDPRTDVLLITVALARTVHQHLQQLQSNQPVKALHLPDEAAFDPRYQDLLQHLLKHWGNPPKRVFKRSESPGAVRICAGLAALEYFIGIPAIRQKPAEGAADVKLSFDLSTLDDSGDAIFRSAHWMVVNQSAGGLALSRVTPPAHETLRIGELLGLKPDHTHHWEIAVVRWATHNEGGELQIGAQMIAPSATVVSLTPENTPRSEAALLLPELAALKQPASLIAARGVYKPARTLRLNENGTFTDILLTRLVERTSAFERFQFSRL